MKNYTIKVSYDAMYDDNAETFEEAKLRVGHEFLMNCAPGVSFADLKFELLGCNEVNENDN